MNSKSKALIVMLCAIVVVAAAVFGTLAYLTDSEAATNTFTVGRVGLKLDEAKVNTNGQLLNKDDSVHKEDDGKELANRVTSNTYHLLPGHTYVKDPTVTIDAGSEESYVRMMVTVSFEKALTDAQLATSLDNIFTGHDASKWIRSSKTVSDDKKTITYEYRYHTTVDGKDAAGNAEEEKLEPLFSAIKVPGEYTNDQIAVVGGMKIVVVAHAIQTSGFQASGEKTAADVAWEAFDEQHKPVTTP